MAAAEPFGRERYLRLPVLPGPSLLWGEFGFFFFRFISQPVLNRA